MQWKKIFFLTLATFSCGRAYDLATRDFVRDLGEAPRTMVYLPMLPLDEEGRPIPIQRNVIDVSTHEKLTMQLVIDTSKTDSKPHSTGGMRICRKSQAGTTVIMASGIARRVDDGGAEYTYLGDLNALKKPGEYSIVFRQRGKEIFTHPMLVIEEEQVP